MSVFVSHSRKLDMVHVQNSTLAGGVAIGSICNMLIGPHIALLTGCVSAVVSVLGYRFLSVKTALHFPPHFSLLISDVILEKEKLNQRVEI